MISFVNFWSRPPRTVERDVALDILEAEPLSKASIRPPKILENELHHAFAVFRVNRVNERREFFFATPVQVRDILTEKVGNLLESTEQPESTQYLQSKGSWPTADSSTRGSEQ